MSANQHQPSHPSAVDALMQRRRQLIQQLGNVDRQLIQYGAITQRTVEPRRQRKARKRE